MTVKITPVENARGLRRFIELPHRVYAGDRNWVPPLHGEVRKLLDRRKNPFFAHSDAALWLAWRGNEPVGRISAQINQLHLDRYHDATGNFGFLEAFDDQETFDTLLATAEQWLRARGMRRSIGPYSPTVNDEIGILVSGFDTPPMVMMGHAPRYYAARLEEAGYRKAKDVHAYRFERAGLSGRTVSRLGRVAERLAVENRITARDGVRKNFDAEMRLLIELYNEAWMDNWGFLPVTDAEAQVLIAAIKPIIREEQVIFGEVDGETVGVLAAIPNINEIITDLDGRLFPFGWAKLLWRLRFAPPTSVRIILAGIRSKYRNSAMSGAIMTAMMARLEKNLVLPRVKLLEMGWILEDNKGSLGVARIYGTLAKTYRIYEKGLGEATPAVQDASSLRHSSAAI